MKKRGKIDTSRIEFGLESLRKELESKKTKTKLHKQEKSSKKKSRIAKFIHKKKIKQIKHTKVKIAKVKNKSHKIKKHKLIHKYHPKKTITRIEVNIPEFLQKKKQNQVLEVPKEKVPTHLFGRKKIIISQEFRKFEERFRYEFVFFFGLIIAILGLLPQNKINLFFIFGISLIVISLTRYVMIKKRKKLEKIETKKEIKSIKEHLVLKEKPISSKHKIRKINTIAAAIILLFTLTIIISKVDFRSLPSNFSFIMIILAAVAVMLFFIIIISRRKTEKLDAQEIDLKVARDLPIEIRKLKMPETYFDLLLEIVNKRGVLSLSEVAKTFRITKQRAEEWATILADHNLITLYFPPIGEPILKKIMPILEKKEEKKNVKNST